jgi:hypothetical protein
MSRHVHLPPLLPYVGPKPLEKKERTRRKASISTGKDDGAAPQPAAAGATKPAAPAEHPVHNAGPIDGKSGAYGVLLTAQEEAQPAEATTRRPDDED